MADAANKPQTLNSLTVSVGLPKCNRQGRRKVALWVSRAAPVPCAYVVEVVQHAPT